MIASRSIAHGLYHFCLLHDLLQKRRNFSADHARDGFQKFWPCFVCEGHRGEHMRRFDPFSGGWNSDCQSPPFLGKHGQDRDRPIDGTSWIDLRRDLALRALWQDSAA